MPFKVSDEEKPKFNKRVQESFTLLSEQLEDVAFQGAASEEPAIELDSIRDANGNIISNSLDLFSTPLNGDKSKALGLVDADGNATDKGELFFNMKEAGMFDDTGVITDKGKAYLMKPIEIRDPKNLPAFTQLWDDGVIRGDETTWEQKGEALMDFGGNILGGIGEIGSNFAKNLYYEPFYYKGVAVDSTPEWLKAENVAVKLSVGEKIATNFMELGRMADIAGNWVADKMMDPAYWGQNETPAREDTKALYASRQRQWAMRETLKDLEVGGVAEMITEVKGIVDEAEKAKEVIGEERFNEIVERTGATTEMFGTPESLIPASFAFKLGKLVPLSNRVSIGAQKVLSKVLIKEVEIGTLETSLEAAKLTVEKGAISNRLTSKFIEEGATIGATPVAISRGQKAAEIAAKTAKITDEATAAIPGLTLNLDEAVKLRNSLSTRIPETAANATLKTLEAGRQLRGLPVKAIGGALEGFGNTLTKIDGSVSNFLKERGLDQMYSAALGAAGVVGVAGSPVIGAIGAGAAALKAGKMITNYGKLFKYVGKEMVKVKGQIPFWRRVAAHTEAGSLNRGIAHTFNMLDLGGVTSDTLRRIPRGIAAAAPSDLMFEWLSDGADMRPETLYQALSESVYIGGSFAAAGGAFMGTKTRMRQLAIGDQLNFNQSLTDPRQKVLYNQLDPGTRNSIATYSIANPTLNYVFKDNGASNYDPNTNTATINVNSNNSIKPLIAHETLHHTLIKNNMEAGISALFLGDTVNNTVGGLLRSKDGKLDPNFKAFTDAYYQRLNIAGMTDAEKNAIYPLDKMAVEYFIEQHSDQYAGMAESGELGAIAASGDIKRKLSGVLETILPRIPVLRDLHFKSGGMIDKDGGWVTGNGILDTGGVKTNPITNKMFRDMNRRSSGLAPGQFEPLVSDKQDSGAQLSLDPSNPIDSELLHPLVKVDENGSPVLVDGKPVALDKATLLERALGGLTAKEVLRRKKADNYIPEKGEAHIDDFGEFQPGWLSNDVLSEMFAKNRYNPEQKRIIREMNRMIRKGDGGRAVMINFPATTRNKAGKVVYKAQGATLRDTVPVAITISKDGNLLFGLMSVNKLQENIQKRSQSSRGKKLYGGNVDLILRDTQAMMQFHKDGVDSIEYFKEKYGSVEATERKNFINTMFGLLNQKEQAVLNPMLVEDGIKSRDNVYRTYRADRVSKAVAMSPNDYPAMPFSYEAASQVKMPEQSRYVPEKLITSSSEEWKSMSNKEKDAYVFTPAEMTPSNRAEFDARVESGSLSADTPVVDINRSNLLTSKYGPPSSSATGNINTWIDDNTGKPVAVAFSKNGNIPTKGERNQTPRYMPEKVDADYMKAVKSKNVEMQQRITNETAKRKGATVGIVHHGTKQRFNTFESKRDTTGLIYFSFDEKFAKNYPRGTGGHRNPTPEIRQRIDAVRAESKKLFESLAEELDKTYPTTGDATEEWLNAWSKHFDDQKAWEKSKLDGMTVSEAEMGMGIQVIPAYLFANRIFDPAANWKEFKSEILERLNEKSINDLNPQTIKMIEDGNYLIWENKNIIDSVFKKYDALILNENGSKNIAVRDPSLIKRADPITRDDAGNVIPPSKRFDRMTDDIRYMPEKVDADYMKAVEDGDVEMQQRAVDEAAKAAGYKFQAKHGTPEKKLFTEFGERGKLTGAKSAEKAFFFSDSEALTDTYRMQNRKEPDETLINDWVDGLSDTQISKLLPRDYRLPMDTPFMVEYARDTIKEQGLDFMNEMGEDIYYGLDELVSKAKSNKIPFPKEFDPKDVGNTYNVKLRIDDPYYFTYDQYEVSGMDGIVKQAIEKGHDGIISKDKISDAFSGWDNKTPPSGIIYAVFDPEQIKSTDPITRDDSGNIIPPSKRFNTESKDIRYMPEPIPANYKSSRDDTYLNASLSPDGRMNATRPFKSTEALPTIAMRHNYPMQELVVSKFDKRESIVYAKNKNGEDVSFKFDPAMMNKPEFADFDDLYEGKVIQFAMADRHSAVDGDMGGHSFPDLKVNQNNIVADQNGKKYKIVWANNAWGPVANMSNKAVKFGATSLLTYNMDQHAHDSNTRTVRIFSNEIANSGLSVADQSTILIVQNVALKKSQTSANKKDLRSLIADRNKANKKLIIDDKIASGKKVKDSTKLSTEDRDALIESINESDLLIKLEEEFLKESLGAKAATSDEMQVDKLFRDYQNKRRAYEKAPDSDKKKKSMEDSELNLRKHQKTKSFTIAEKLLPSRELDTFSNTFKGRKSLINAIKTKTAAAKWGMFDAKKISETIGDQMTGDSLHVVGSVELSSDPNFKAVYLGDDPREIARMTPAEQAAAAQLKANPDFVGHEAYLWAMLGPAESKHYFNTNQRSVLDSVPNFVDEYSQLPVKGDKKKLNDPESKASEFNIVNTVRDQSKIPVVFKAEPKQTDEE